MGIPFYYHNIILKYGNIIDQQLKTCDRLFLDFNSIIHPCSANVVHKDPNFTFQDIFKEISEYTLKITNICKPTQLLYIAVDGVAPRAKIQQQRKRRYTSAYRNQKINEFKLSSNSQISNWDSNCITPGTSFMNELDTYLKTFFKNLQADFKIIISGHHEQGEGEHKIIQYLKKYNNDELNVIYGLDADLIMLSLGCEKTNIFLMRENSDISKNLINNIQDSYFRFVNINTLRISISKYLYNTDNIDQMYDYIFLCFFLGNDFLPNITFMKIKTGAVDILCDIYKKIYTSLNKNLVIRQNDTFKINLQFLQNIFELLTKIEDDYMKKTIDQYYNQDYYPKKTQHKLDKLIFELDSLPIIHKYPNIIKPSTDPQWKAKYYYYLLGSHSSSLIKDSSLKYIEGLLWILNYYFNHNFDLNWFYPYDYTPCVSDLYKYSCTINSEMLDDLCEQLQNTKDIPITVLHQMLMVLPSQSKKWIPDKYQKLYTDLNFGCVHYFPTQFKFSTFLKHQLWECHPILPTIKLEYLDEYIKKI